MAIDLKSIAGGQNLLPPKVVLMGVGGVGKTTFAAAAPSPIFIPTERGQGLLDIQRFEPDGQGSIITTWQQILDCIGVLYKDDHPYKTVVLDSMDFAEPMLWAHTAAMHGKDDIEAFGYGKGLGVYAPDQARILLRGLDALRNDRGMAVIVICHTDVVRFDDPDAESYDRFQPRLHKRLAAMLHDWTDCMLFANYKKHVAKDKTRAGQKEEEKRRRGVGAGQRVLFTEERPAFWAKNRYRLPFELPLDWQAFQNAIAAGKAMANPNNPKKEQ